MRINNVNFELIKKGHKKYEQLLANASRYDGKCVTNVYLRPSQSKRIIDNYWWNFCLEINGDDYSICSHNTKMFTLSFVTEQFVFYITPTHNYILER